MGFLLQWDEKTKRQKDFQGTTATATTHSKILSCLSPQGSSLAVTLSELFFCVHIHICTT